MNIIQEAKDLLEKHKAYNYEQNAYCHVSREYSDLISRLVDRLETIEREKDAMHDIIYQKGFRAGWNAGINEKTEVAEAVEAMGRTARYELRNGLPLPPVGDK